MSSVSSTTEHPSGARGPREVPSRQELAQRLRQAVLTRWYVGILFVSVVFLTIFPVQLALVLRIRDGALDGGPYTILTYALVHAGFLHWLVVAVWIVLLGLIVEPHISRGAFTAITVGGVLGGALTALLLSASSRDTLMLVGSSPVVHVLAGAATAMVAMRGKALTYADFALVLLADAMVLFREFPIKGLPLPVWLIGLFGTLAYLRFQRDDTAAEQGPTP